LHNPLSIGGSHTSSATGLIPHSQEGLARRLRSSINAMDLNACRQALTEGANPNVKYAPARQYTIFTHAIAKRFTAGVLLMLEHGASVEAKRERGFISPLFTAAYANNAEICEALLSRGARVDARNFSRSTALLTAARSACIDVGNLLVKGGADLSIYDRRHRTALHKAVASKNAGALEFVKLLLGAGAEPNFVPPTPAPDYRTPFQWALTHATPDVVAYLVENYIDLVDQPTLAGQDLLDIASGANAKFLLAARAARSVECAIGSGAGSPTGLAATKSIGPL
jgi:hypothetical protein